MDLVNEQQALLKQLSATIKELEQHGIELATKERDYKIILNQHVLALREDGIAVTLIDKVAYGIKEVAQARLDRDIADTMYNVCREKINGIKLKVRINEEQIKREWSNEHTT
jgi:hypothetical protein